MGVGGWWRGRGRGYRSVALQLGLVRVSRLASGASRCLFRSVDPRTPDFVVRGLSLVRSFFPCIFKVAVRVRAIPQTGPTLRLFPIGRRGWNVRVRDFVSEILSQ